MRSRINKIIMYFAFLIFVVLMYMLFSGLVPLLKQVVQDAGNEAKLIDYVHTYGAKGIPILAGLQFVQVFIPFFPAAPVQMLAGLCYGVGYGALICIISFVAAHFVIFCAVRRLGGKLAFLFEKIGKKSSSKDSLSDRIKRPEIAVFLMYLIPAIPNGALPFVFAETKISYSKYLLSTTAAAIPSITLCSWFGERMSSGDYKSAILIFGGIIIIVLLLMLFKNKILGKITK